MPLCNILPRQRGQRRVALNYYVLARRASTPLFVSSKAETLAKYQLSTAWWNEYLASRGHDSFWSTVQYLQSKVCGTPV